MIRLTAGDYVPDIIVKRIPNADMVQSIVKSAIEDNMDACFDVDQDAIVEQLTVVPDDDQYLLTLVIRCVSKDYQTKEEEALAKISANIFGILQEDVGIG